MTRFGADWVKFRALSGHEQRTLLAAMTLLPLFWLGLRVLGLRRLLARLQNGNSTQRHEVSLDEIVRLGTLVNIAALRGPFPANCLTRSLLLTWLLRRRGIANQLRIGVHLADGRLDAHAWVEHAGTPVNDSADVGERFPAFAETPSLRAFHLP